MSPETLAEVEARANAATPGPWTGDDWGVYADREQVAVTFDGEYIENRNHTDDAAFIAAAREDVPALVAEVKRLRALVEAGS